MDGEAKERWQIRLLAVLTVAIGSFTWFFLIPPAGTINVSFSRADAVCTNFIGADGSNWIAQEEPTGDPIEGVFTFDGDSGLLVQPDGNRLGYERSTKWGPCMGAQVID